jgi:hypothetical protein
MQKLVLVLMGIAACGGSNGGGDDEGGGGDGIVVIAPAAPDATVAYREHDATTWQVLARSATGRYEVPDPAGPYTVVVTCPVSGQKRVAMYELRADDVQEIRHQYPCASTTSMITGSVTGATSTATLFWGGHRVTATTGGYSFPMPNETHDLVAIRNGGNTGIGLELADRVVLRRGVAAGGTVDVDVSDANGMATQRLNVTGLVYSDRTTVRARSYVMTSGGTYAQLSDGQLFDQVPLQVDTLPASALEASELNLVSLLLIGGDVGNATLVRIQERTAASFAGIAQSFLPGDDATPPAISWNGVMPYAKMRTLWRPVPAAAYRLVATTTFTGELIEWVINTSFADSAGDITWVFPDLSTLPGWSQDLGFRPLANVSWQVTTRTGAPLAQLIQQYATVEASVDSSGFGGFAMIPPF